VFARDSALWLAPTCASFALPRAASGSSAGGTELAQFAWLTPCRADCSLAAEAALAGVWDLWQLDSRPV
jgi:hypothetical protein